MSDITQLKAELDSLRDELRQQGQTLTKRVNDLQTDSDHLHELVAELMAQEPFPIVLNDENGRVIAVDGKSIEKLEDELPVGLGPNKRQKLDDQLQDVSRRIPAQAVANAVPEEEEKEPLKVPSVVEAEDNIREEQVNFLHHRCRFQLNQGEPICLNCFFIAAEIMFCTNGPRKLRLITKRQSDRAAHSEELGNRRDDDPDVVCWECGNLMSKAPRKLTF